MQLQQALAEIVGSRHVLSDPDLTSSYESDYTGRYRGRAPCVVRPADSDEVAGMMAACAGSSARWIPTTC